MVAKILDGKELAGERYELLKVRVMDMERTPSLAVVLVGDDYASHLYVKLKEKAAKKAGIDFHKYVFEADISQEMLCESVAFLRADDDIDGILIQLPLPEHLNADRIIDAMGPEKDVDGFHPENIQKFISGERGVHPVFPQALIDLAEASEQSLTGKTAVIIGKSDIFTSAMVAAAERVGMRIERIDCGIDLAREKVVQEADVIFTACGVPEMLRGAHIKEDAIVIDGGIAEVDGKSVGDVRMESVVKKASYVTPVPGGVGPMTIACLLDNVVSAAQRNRESV